MEEPFTFLPLNLDGHDDQFIFESPRISQSMETSWQYNNVQPQTQYNFLQSSVSSDIKVQTLDDELLIENSVSHCIGTTSVTVKPEQQAVDSKSRARKKRKRTEKDTKGDVSFVQLSREQLLIMSSCELEERVKFLQQQRPLTPSENEEIKRQRKLIKNREYAQTSRTKKRETLSTLKCQLSEASLQNEVLKIQVNHLSQRVQYLEQENNQLRTFLTHSPTHSAPQPVNIPSHVIPSTLYPPSNIPSVPSCSYVYSYSPESSTYSDVGSPSSVSIDESNDPFFGTITSDSDDAFALEVGINDMENPLAQLDVSEKKSWGITHTYTHGLCLLVILFSFGLFFSGVPGTHVPELRSTARTLFGLEDGEVVDMSGKTQMEIPNLEEAFISGKNHSELEFIQNVQILNDLAEFDRKSEMCFDDEMEITGFQTAD